MAFWYRDILKGFKFSGSSLPNLVFISRTVNYLPDPCFPPFSLAARKLRAKLVAPFKRMSRTSTHAFCVALRWLHLGFPP